MRRFNTVLWKIAYLSLEKDIASRGAAVAFFLVTSLAPVLVIVIAMTGLVFGDDAARGVLVQQLSETVGGPAAQLLERVIVGASQVSTDIFATVLSVLTIIVVASGVFAELQSALNSIFGFAPKGQHVWRFIWTRLVSFSIVLVIGMLMVVALALEAAVAALGGSISDNIRFSVELLRGEGFALSLASTTIFFALVYRLLPARVLSVRDIFRGALLTMILFTLGKEAIGLYLGSRMAATTLGAGGAVIGLLLWVYYSSVIVLFSAVVVAVLRNEREDLARLPLNEE